MIPFRRILNETYFVRLNKRGFLLRRVRICDILRREYENGVEEDECQGILHG